MRLIITGPPGAGKGTQSSRIAERYGVPAISTGAIFRQNIADGTALGKQVKAIMDAGDLVGDDVTDALVADRLTWEDTASGWLLDGYPRNVNQIAALDATLAEAGHDVDVVLALTADTEALVDRLLGRAAVEGRSDDNADTIRNRMVVYRADTAPVLAVYRERGKVVEVDGLGSVDEVTQRIFDAVDPVAGHQA